MPEITENYVRIPVGKRPKKGAKIRTITITKDIKALYNVDTKTVVTYLFDKEKYTMKEAKKWVKKHTANLENADEKEHAFIENFIKTLETLIELDFTRYKQTALLIAQKEAVLLQLSDEEVVEELDNDDLQMRIL